jgi:formylglycine-generating enzyme required for sulfatase activity
MDGQDPCADLEPPDTDRGPDMVVVERPNGSCIWVDRTEVTRDQYNLFIDSEPTPLSDPTCDWNTDFTTTTCEMAAEGTTAVISSAGDHPIVCVDQCDAVAFCIWAGKELCPGPPSGGVDGDTDAWHAACAGKDNKTYPYGGMRDPNLCNGIDNSTTGCTDGTCTTVSAGELQGCVSDADAIHLSGNVAEWTAGCDGMTGENNGCRVRGGSAGSNPAQLTCAMSTVMSRNETSPFVGFRCCVVE